MGALFLSLAAEPGAGAACHVSHAPGRGVLTPRVAGVLSPPSRMPPEQGCAAGGVMVPCWSLHPRAGGGRSRLGKQTGLMVHLGELVALPALWEPA